MGMMRVAALQLILITTILNIPMTCFANIDTISSKVIILRGVVRNNWELNFLSESEFTEIYDNDTLKGLNLADETLVDTTDIDYTFMDIDIDEPDFDLSITPKRKQVIKAKYKLKKRYRKTRKTTTIPTPNINQTEIVDDSVKPKNPAATSNLNVHEPESLSHDEINKQNWINELANSETNKKPKKQGSGKKLKAKRKKSVNKPKSTTDKRFEEIREKRKAKRHDRSRH